MIKYVTYKKRQTVHKTATERKTRERESTFKIVRRQRTQKCKRKNIRENVTLRTGVPKDRVNYRNSYAVKKLG